VTILDFFSTQNVKFVEESDNSKNIQAKLALIYFSGFQSEIQCKSKSYGSMQNIGLPWQPYWIYNPHRTRKLCTEPHNE
jgi:hypothetical protein